MATTKAERKAKRKHNMAVLDSLKLQRDAAMRRLWVDWQARIAKARADLWR